MIFHSYFLIFRLTLTALIAEIRTTLTAPNGRGDRLHPLLVKIHNLMINVIIYLLILLLAYLFQRKLIYYPDNYTLDQLQNTATRLNLNMWPSQANYRGFISAKPPMQMKGTVIVFHGNAGSAIGRTYYIDALQKLGYRVILAEYPGYGGREGNLSEPTLVDDGIETVQTALSQFGEPLYLWGESLGCGIVSGIVKNSRLPIQSIVLLMPFDSLPKIANTHYWFLLGGLLTRDKYNNINNLRHYTGKIAVLLGKQDNVIPNKHTLNLYQKLQTDKKLWSFDHAGHNDWPTSSDFPWWKEVMQFVAPK